MHKKLRLNGVFHYLSFYFLSLIKSPPTESNNAPTNPIMLASPVFGSSEILLLLGFLDILLCSCAGFGPGCGVGFGAGCGCGVGFGSCIIFLFSKTNTVASVTSPVTSIVFTSSIIAYPSGALVSAIVYCPNGSFTNASPFSSVTTVTVYPLFIEVIVNSAPCRSFSLLSESTFLITISDTASVVKLMDFDILVLPSCIPIKL